MKCILSYIIYVILLLLSSCNSRHTLSDDAEMALNELDSEIARIPEYNKAKEERIEILRELLYNSHRYEEYFNHLFDLFKEYEKFQSDSSIVYGQRMLAIATEHGDKNGIELSNIALTNAYVSSGLFMEARDCFETISIENIDSCYLQLYWRSAARMYQNTESLIGYESNYLLKRREQRRECLEHIIALSPDSSYEHDVYTLELQNLTYRNQSTEKEGYKKLLSKYNLSDAQKAFVYFWIGASSEGYDEQIYYMTLSAIHDIRGNIRETAAARTLADLLTAVGDNSAAYKYATRAYEDATLFNTRFRHNELEQIFPAISNERYELLRDQRRLTILILVIILIVLVIFIVLFRKLHNQNQVLQQAQSRLVEKSNSLTLMNESLTNLNEQLAETCTIKDEFIRQSLFVSMDFVNNVENTCIGVVKKLKEKDYDSLRFLPFQMGIKDERKRLLLNFDHAFMEIFPNFIDKFNNLFSSSTYELGENGELPPDVRIFALMRIGISDPIEVAKYLNLNVRTVYVYKTRVKSLSNIDNSEFDRAVMAIN